MTVSLQPWSGFGPLKYNLYHQCLILALNSCASGEFLISESRPHIWWKSICNNLTCSISPLPDCQIVSRAGRRRVCYSIYCSIFFIVNFSENKREALCTTMVVILHLRQLGQRCVFHPTSLWVLHVHTGKSTGYLRECTLPLEWEGTCFQAESLVCAGGARKISSSISSLSFLWSSLISSFKFWKFLVSLSTEEM